MSVWASRIENLQSIVLKFTVGVKSSEAAQSTSLTSALVNNIQPLCLNISAIYTVKDFMIEERARALSRSHFAQLKKNDQFNKYFTYVNFLIQN